MPSPPLPTLPPAGVSVPVEELIRLQGEVVGRGFVSSRPVTAPLAGGYLSPFRGRGVEFEETRVYLPGDDVRNLDWRVTARTGVPHTKLFREERERPVFLVLDLNPSMAFGTRRAFKSVTAARAAAILAWSAVHHGDRVGGLLFGTEPLLHLRPAARHKGVLPLLHAISRHLPGPPGGPPSRPPYPLGQALERLRRLARPGSLHFVISDCHTWDDSAEQELNRLHRHHDLALLWIHDPLEAALPEGAGRILLSDGARRVALDCSHPGVRREHAQRFARRRERLARFCRQQGIPLVPLTTDTPPGPALRKGLLPLLHHHPRRPQP